MSQGHGCEDKELFTSRVSSTSRRLARVNSILAELGQLRLLKNLFSQIFCVTALVTLATPSVCHTLCLCACVCVNGQPITLPDYRSWYQLCCPEWRQANVLRLSSELLAQTWLRAHTYNHANHNQQYETCLTHWRHIISWPWRENCKTRLVVFACRRLLFSCFWSQELWTWWRLYSVFNLSTSHLPSFILSSLFISVIGWNEVCTFCYLPHVMRQHMRLCAEHLSLKHPPI